jgi:hypothetical protein
MDHIAQLEADIQIGFCMKKSAVAVFLDIKKAFDSVLPQGLVYKIAKMGIPGFTLTSYPGAACM